MVFRSMAGSIIPVVRHLLVLAVGFSYEGKCLYRILRCYHLRVIVIRIDAVTSDRRKFMAVRCCEFRPGFREIPAGHGAHGGTPVLVYRLGFTPDTDIRIVFGNEFLEMHESILLVAPHSVLDVPVHHAKTFFRTFHLRGLHHLYVVQVETVVQGLDIAFAGPVQHCSVRGI